MSKQKQWVWWAFISLVFLISAYSIAPFSQILNRCGSYLLYPLLKSYCVVESRYERIVGWVHSCHTLEQQLKQTREECNFLKEELIKLQAVSDYYDDISDLCLFKKRYTQYNAAIVSQILLIHCAADEHYLLVEGGTDRNITEGMIALVDNNILGRVIEVYSYYSKVILITDKRINIAAYCSRTRTKGIVVGTNNTHLELKFVDHFKQLHEGDLVLSSGQGLLYPRGLCVGRIVSFVKKHVAYDVTLEPFFDITHITHCFLIHPQFIH